MAVLALGVNGVTQGRRASVGLLTMTLVAGTGLSLDIRTVVTIGAIRRILIHMIVMAPGELAHFRMMTLGACRLRKGGLVGGNEFRVKLCHMAGSARNWRKTRVVTLVVAFSAVISHLIYVFYVTRMGEDYIAAFIIHTETDRQLFRRGWRKLTTDGQKCQHTADNGDGYVTFFQDSVLVLRFDATKDRTLFSSVHLRQDKQNWEKWNLLKNRLSMPLLNYRFLVNTNWKFYKSE